LTNVFTHPVVALRTFTHTLLAYGPQGLFVLAILDSAGVPIVGGVDALLIAICTAMPKQAYVAATLAIAGSLLGSSFLFFLARKGGDVFLHKQISTGPGKRLHLFFQRYGLVTIFLPALSPIPLPLKIPVFCAGALQVRFEYFLMVLMLARSIRYFGLAYLAVHYGQATFLFVRAHGWELGGGILLVAVIVMTALRLLQKREVSLGIPQ
jgi:membrane protein YqaA with SNARE-associated domain